MSHVRVRRGRAAAAAAAAAMPPLVEWSSRLFIAPAALGVYVVACCWFSCRLVDTRLHDNSSYAWQFIAGVV